MIDEAFIERWATRLRREFPEAVAVILKGSYARGEPLPHSDVDFDVLTSGGPREEYPVYFDTIGGKLVHVSVAVRDLDGWLATEREPQTWAFGLPAAEATRLLWAADAPICQRLDRPPLSHPPAEPELEDLVAELGKVRNAQPAGDELGLRLAAHSLASLCPTILRLINPVVRADTPLKALRLVLDFPVAPPNYREDMLTCLGLTARASSPDDVVQAAARLVAGTVELLTPYAYDLKDDLQPGQAEQLADGTLRRYVDQLIGEPA
jgi:phosphoribosyl-AMP cyclohydrolase